MLALVGLGLVLAAETLALSGIVPLLITLVVIGVVLYLINTYVPMDGPIKTIINVIIVLVLCVWLLRWAGLY